MSLLTNMQMGKEEAKEETQPSVADAPKYPWGLCITLNDDSLKKLGIDKLPEVGSEVTIIAKAEVASARLSQTQCGETESSIDLQKTDMKLGGLEMDAAKVLYGKPKA